MRTEKRIARGAWKYLANGRDTVSVMRFKTPDGSIVDMRGRGVLYSSCDRFIDEVVLQRACFLCGSKPSEVEFNDEHVLPRWLLKKHNLFDQAINLPNLTALKYGQYKTPCCKPCNSYLGRTTEQPIRNALSGGFATLDAHVRTHGTGCLFRWLSLIYLKTHLKDLALRLDRTGKFLGNIGDDHEWALLHHVHCIVRSELVGANLAPTAFGSLIIISVNAEGFADSYFDFADNHLGRTVLLGTGDVGVVAVMDDSCGVFSV